jgi:acetamidase/formamidase
VKHLALSLAVLALAPPAFAQTAAPLAGKWAVSLDNHGTPIYLPMDLKQDGAAISGTMFNDKAEGSFANGLLHVTATNPRTTAVAEAKVSGGAMTGQLTVTNKDEPTPEHYAFTATKMAAPRVGPPQRHEFTPTVFHRQFSPNNPPVLHVFPGDTIHTTTVDAGGSDENGKQRVLGGNPQTGPFYIETAMPGDTLVVHIKRLKLNRDYAISDDAIVGRGLDEETAVQMKDGGKPVRWRLDRDKGLAFLEKPGEHTAAYSVPVRPMLGCIATAPPPAAAPPPTGDSGFYGGNMDFNEIGEGATVYLPVSVPGALLYFGDAHALQGDGELNGNALETSMDVEVTVDLISGRSVPGPRVESDTHIMAMGLAGSLDDAFRAANSNMVAWLTHDHKLTPSEIAEVMGTAVEYRISEVADRNAGVVAKLSKERLAKLAEGAPPSAPAR